MVIAIKLGANAKEKVIGVAYADATLRKLGVCEIVDTDLYSNLEALVVQLNVKECVTPDEKNSYELTQVKNVLERCGVVVTEQPKTHFVMKNIDQDLTRLLNEAGATKAKSTPMNLTSLSLFLRNQAPFFFFFSQWRWTQNWRWGRWPP